MAYYWAMAHSLGTSGLDKLGLQRAMKTDSKTDKWKSDRALARIKNDCPYNEMLHIFGYITNRFQSLSHNAVLN